MAFLIGQLYLHTQIRKKTERTAIMFLQEWKKVKRKCKGHNFIEKAKVTQGIITNRSELSDYNFRFPEFKNLISFYYAMLNLLAYAQFLKTSLCKYLNLHVIQKLNFF